MTDIKLQIKNLIQRAILECFDKNLDLEDIPVFESKNPKWGDFSCSVAFRLAKDLNMESMEVAERISNKMNEILINKNI